MWGELGVDCGGGYEIKVAKGCSRRSFILYLHNVVYVDCGRPMEAARMDSGTPRVEEGCITWDRKGAEGCVVLSKSSMFLRGTKCYIGRVKK